MKLTISKFLIIIGIFGVTANNGFANFAESAGHIQITGEQEVELQLNTNTIKKSSGANLRSSVMAVSPVTHIKVLKLELSPQAKAELEQTSSIIQDERDIDVIPTAASFVSGAAINLEMNGVPVLDQGIHGTCTTFAVTAALDAHMNQGDYISQQCLLELGVALELPGSQSGWRGVWSDVVLTRISTYGVISKKDCPHTYSDPTAFLSNSEYIGLSNKLWSESFNFKNLSPNNLDQLKTALTKGHRVIISTKLHANYVAGEPIKGSAYGLWKLPNNLTNYVQELNNGNTVGHTVVVTGYDDNTGLLKIRNSWGVRAGVSGDYYMTYEFYKLMNLEAIEIF